MKTMAETLAEHKLDVTVYLITDAEYLCICGKRSTCHENHQEEALSAAGYGPVREAQATMLRDIVDDFSVNLTVMSGPRIRDWLRARADRLASR